MFERLLGKLPPPPGRRRSGQAHPPDRQAPSANGHRGAHPNGSPDGPGSPYASRLQIERAEEDYYRRLYEEVPTEDLFDPPARERLAKAITWLVVVFAAIGVLVFGLVMVRGLAGPPSETNTLPAEAADGEASSAPERAAAAVAENFAEAYLTIDPAESSSEAHERLEPFLAAGLAPDAVAPRSGGDLEREVLSIGTQRVESLGGGRYAVYADSRLLTRQFSAEELEDRGGGEEAAEDAGTDPEAEESAGVQPSESLQEDRTLTRSLLKVYVGGEPQGASEAAPEAGDAGAEGDSPSGPEAGAGPGEAPVGGGALSVVAPPVALESPPPYAGEAGALSAAGGEALELTDEELERLLRGYFAAAYGSTDTQGSLEQFYADGVAGTGREPDTPAGGHTYIDLAGATLYQTGAPAPGAPEGFVESYRVEAYVSTREESTGSTANQTHLLEVAQTEEGEEWLITGSGQ